MGSQQGTENGRDNEVCQGQTDPMAWHPKNNTRYYFMANRRTSALASSAVVKPTRLFGGEGGDFCHKDEPLPGPLGITVYSPQVKPGGPAGCPEGDRDNMTGTRGARGTYDYMFNWRTRALSVGDSTVLSLVLVPSEGGDDSHEEQPLKIKCHHRGPSGIAVYLGRLRNS